MAAAVSNVRLLTLASLLFMSAATARSVDCAPKLPNTSLQQGIGVIGLDLVNGLPNLTANTAIGYWENGCAGQPGNYFPDFTLSGSYDALITVTYVDGVSTNTRGGCGVTTNHF